MIDIQNKTDCCGCSACAQICPKKCITMKADNEGFLYPHINVVDCIDCNLCEKVCPVINKYESKSPLASFACKAHDEQLVKDSSSGGVVSILSKYVIQNQGVVYGASFDNNWMVNHSSADSEDDLIKFRGSKYVQSNIGQAYQEVKEYLLKGRIVLFIGTPCQVAGLNHFLRKKYDHLLTIDIICHSVPSPKVWKLYLDEISKKGNSYIKNVTFRDKSFGWRDYALHITGCSKDGSICSLVHEPKSHNIYMRGFLQDLYTRPSCSKCPARNYTSGSDFTIGDFWGYDKYYPDRFDEKGMSVVLLNTEKASKIFKDIESMLISWPIPYEQVEPTSLHLPLTASSRPHKNRERFYTKIDTVKSISSWIYSNIWYLESKRKIYRTIKKIISIIR